MNDSESEIPVVFSTDENYVFPTIVAMISMLRSSRTTTFYHFYLLVPTDFPSTFKQNILNIEMHHSNCIISFLVMGDQFDDLNLSISHISLSTYYRLQICDFLSECDKCIYLDSDIIVNEDLVDFFNIDIDDYYLAGVKAPGYHFPADGNKSYCEKIGLPSIDQYINAGVLLMNLKKIRENHLAEDFIRLAQNALPSQDQDVLNIACYNHIKHLHFRYNNMLSKYQGNITNVKKVISEQEFNEVMLHTGIFHFCDKVKPWQDVLCYNANIWWKYAKETPIYRDILLEYSPQIIENYFKKSMNYETEICELEDEVKASKDEIKTLKIEINKLKSEVRVLENMNEAFKNSPSYKIGRFITYFPRKIRDLFK